jgi:iron complex transport system ATP-binding protein
MKLQTTKLSWRPSAKSALILEGVDFHAQEGLFIGLLGPNGSGKTSLLRCLYRGISPTGGSIYLDDKNITHYSQQEIAKKVAVVLQESPQDIGLSVSEIVKLGRLPYQGFFTHDRDTLTDHERTITQHLELDHLLTRLYQSLSGGEKQRVMIARALIQKPDVLLLDEPTNHLDIAHQLSILRYISNLDITVICSLHDLNLAAQYCDEVAIMRKGHLISQGKPNEVLTYELIKRVFAVNSTADTHPATGSQRLSFY